MANQGNQTALLRDRHIRTLQLLERPYSCITYLQRAISHEKLGYPDLAIGDAYRALLLTDEIIEESGEYHKQAFETFESDLGIEWPADSFWVKSGNEKIEEKRGLEINPGNAKFLDFRRKAIQTHNKSLLEKDPKWDNWTYNPSQELPDQGSARRELYPWNDHEPDRFREESLKFLDEEMKKVAPKCEVRAVSLPVLETGTTSKPLSTPSATNTQLGVFAKEDIAPHEILLQERSLLTANNRLHDPLCDACSAPLPPISALEEPLPTCPECDDIIFCSQTCFTLATSLYHPAVCGKSDLEAVAKDPSPLAATNALYLLLLGRTFALSETQSIHPLDLRETKYLWGDFTPLEQEHSSQKYLRQLPFTFEDNILAPLHLLTKMDIDIFASLPTTDTWIIATLLAKFRGVASARMNPRTGMPEVCAVHPMWCLANHSCAPNVKWEWSGEIKFEARGGEDVVRWGGMCDREGKGGVRKGEEVLNHYCDVGLGVRERREWAVGALGGSCVCERCVWEEGKEQRKMGE
ncbi:MAG: hypothetical protein Q9182_002118 [Xanthomendoza sp. 2 TL-2023]